MHAATGTLLRARPIRFARHDPPAPYGRRATPYGARDTVRAPWSAPHHRTACHRSTSPSYRPQHRSAAVRTAGDRAASSQRPRRAVCPASSAPSHRLHRIVRAVCPASSAPSHRLHRIVRAVCPHRPRRPTVCIASFAPSAPHRPRRPTVCIALFAPSAPIRHLELVPNEVDQHSRPRATDPGRRPRVVFVSPRSRAWLTDQQSADACSRAELLAVPPTRATPEIVPNEVDRRRCCRWC